MAKYDLVIVGGGPAGMSAALYASRQNLRFLVISKDIGGLASYVPEIDTYLGFHYVTGYSLVEKFKEHLKDYRVPIAKECVCNIKKVGKEFTITTDRSSYKSKTVIIASGRRFKQLNIPGEKEFLYKGVSECTACDGPLFKNRTVAVIGGGRTGLYATLYLLKIAKKIYLIEKEKDLKASGGVKVWADAVKNSSKVEIMSSTEVKEIRGDSSVKELLLKRKGKFVHLPVDGVFIEIGYIPNTDFVKAVKKNERGEIITDKECKTNIPGLFAAGDITNTTEKQVIISASDGAKATLSAVVYLEEHFKK